MEQKQIQINDILERKDYINLRPTTKRNCF